MIKKRMNGFIESPTPDKDCDCGVFSNGKLCMGNGCGCPKESPTPHATDWEKRFDERFGKRPHFECEGFAECVCSRNFKDFIRTTVDEVEKRAFEKGCATVDLKAAKEEAYKLGAGGTILRFQSSPPS